MSKSLRNFLVTGIIALLLGCTAREELQPPPEPIEKPPAPLPFLWVIRPNINIRVENSAGSEKRGTLAEGDSVMIHGNTDGWYDVETTGGTRGWVRTDLLAPRNLSVFRKAVEFSDKLQTEEGIDLYFDRNLQHQRIYLSFPDDMYASRDRIETAARDLTSEYQNQVYPGNVSVRVLKPGSEEEYLTFEQTGQPNPDALVPVIPFGRLNSVTTDGPRRITLAIMLSERPGNENLLRAARSMAGTFPLSYEKVTIRFVSSDNTCLLWFSEDAAGEQHRFGECPGQ